MNLGAPELVSLLLAGFVFVFPIYGIMKAILAKDWGWVAAIVISTGLAVGGIATVIYLLSHRHQVRA